MTHVKSHVELLADYIAGARERQLPEEVREAARLCLADWLAVAIGARNEAAGRVVREAVARWGSKGRATVIYGGTAAAPFAALANGTLAHCLDFDDTYVPAVTHTSAPVWAAVLALGQDRAVSEEAMLRAFVTGFEVAARVGGGLGQAVTQRGLHSTGVFGRIGAAAGCAALLGLDAKAAANALAAAATQAGGLVASFGTMAKPFHAGKAAANMPEPTAEGKIGQAGWALSRISHRQPTTQSTRKGTRARLIACHDKRLSMTPEDIAPTLTVPKTRKSFAAWVLARSAGRCASPRSVLAPT